MQVTPHMLLIVCPLVFLAGFVDSIGGGGGLISLPAYLFAAFRPTQPWPQTSCLPPSEPLYPPPGCSDTWICPWPEPAWSAPSWDPGAGSSLALLASEELVRFMLLPVLPVVAYYVLRKKDLNTTEKEPLSRRNTFLVSMPASMLIVSTTASTARAPEPS